MRRTIAAGIAIAVTGLTLAFGGSPARAIPIAGDYSVIDLTTDPALTAAGVVTTALGTAEIHHYGIPGVTLAVLPVTGGDVDLPTSFLGTVEHDGSGLRLSFLGVDLDFTNLVMSTITGKVTADFTVGAASGTAEIFDILPCDSGAPGTCATIPGGAVIPSALRLTFSADGAALVAFAFGIPGLAGVQFGVWNTALRAVPEPGTALLVSGALAGLAAIRRSRRA